MARTAAGAALTVQHRQAQLQIRARTLRDFQRLWPLWTGDEVSFRRLVEATQPLVRVYHGLSGSLGLGYYEAFRRAERIGGSPTPRTAPTVDTERVTSSLYVTGLVMTRDAIAGGYSPQAAMQTALVRTSGAVTRHALAGGREAILLSSDADRQARAWARVTGGNPCAFCALLSSRGPIYGEDAGVFEAHDHCACSLEPTYEDSDWPGRAREYRALYDEHAKGTEDPLNSFRRALEGRVQET